MKKIFLACFSVLFLACQTTEQRLVSVQGTAQGSTYHITYISTEKVDFKPSIDSILEVIDVSMSTYQDDSLISQVNRNDSVQVDEHFKKVFAMSQQVWQESGGFFDPSINKLIEAWGFGKKNQHKVLSQSQIDSIRSFVGMDKLKLTEGNTIFKENKEIQLNFNAIAQGYTCDVIAEFFLLKKIENFIIEVGGEIRVMGKNIQENRPWSLGIDNPMSSPENRELFAIIQPKNCGLATSGNYRKVWKDSLTGETFVHTINPKTGRPFKSNLLSATVIAPTAMQADAYATTLMAMGEAGAKNFLQAHPQIKALLLVSQVDSSEIQPYMANGFENDVKEFIRQSPRK